MARYQQLSGENLPDFIKLTAVVNGLKGNVRHYVFLQLDGDSAFGDLDSLLGEYFNNTYVQIESSLNSVWDKAWRDKQKGKSKGKGKKPNSYYKQKLHKGGKGKGKEKEGKGKGKGKQAKGKGEALPPQPPANKGKGKQQLPKREQWCVICWQKGHSTPSLLVEYQPAAATAAPTRASLVLSKPTTTVDCPTTAAAGECTSFSAKAAASSPQHRPADNLHQLDSR